MEKRIKDLHFRKATYIGEEPEHPSYHIDKWYPNSYYKQEHNYIKEGDFYKYKDPLYANCRIHKNCFKNPESCYAIASFYWDSKEETYNFEFICDRPLYLNKEEQNNFWELIKYGFKTLNNEVY